MTHNAAIAEVIHFAEVQLESIRRALAGSTDSLEAHTVSHQILIKDSVVRPLELKKQWKDIIPCLQVKIKEMEDTHGAKTYLRDLKLYRHKQGPHTILEFKATLQFLKQ